ncbi:MAG: HNH/ENDO VII family nuclease [Lachnospiraceae bacterium]|nr:HNH/ENDO VII family nuclease [Lachnospiraceae bacterium]
MKRILAIILILSISLSGCGLKDKKEATDNDLAHEFIDSNIVAQDSEEPVYTGLDDTELLAHIEDLVYRDAVLSFNSAEYIVEGVNATYVSKEYLEEVAYNSQSNIFFGFTLDGLNEIFQDTRYIFTLGENGKTTVEALQEIEDDSMETMLKNLAIGTGVILVCVTVSVVSAGAGAPAISMIFAASATTAETFAISSAAFGGISAGVVRGIQTGDFNEALEAAALGASEGFKWGAISGAVIGGASEAFLLNVGTKNGLTMNEVALIQVDSQYPIEVIARFNSIEQYKICRDAGLKANMVNGKTALVRKIDLNYVDELTGKTNLQLMQDGYAPIDPTGQKYQLHHIGQSNDSPLAILTQAEHMGNGNDSIWHVLTEGFDNPSSQPGWSNIRAQFWKDYARQAVSGGV